MPKGTVALSWGDWGGVYAKRGYSWRLCFGWVALTWLPIELDDLVEGYARADALEARLGDAMALVATHAEIMRKTL